MWYHFIVFIFISSVHLQETGEIFRWTTIKFHNLPRAPSYKIENQDYYIEENNIPTGITPSFNRLFITIPRRGYGVPSTLSYIDLRTTRESKSPLLWSYPSYEFNELHQDLKADSNKIVSVYRSRVDDCNRLWFVDTGVLEIDDVQRVIQNASIWVIDLRTNKMVKRFEIKDSYKLDPIGFKSITVDTDRSRCEETFAYIPNSRSNKLLIYSLKHNDTWVFSDPTFHPSEDLDNLVFDMKTYPIRGGIYSVTLGARNTTRRTKTVYYHPLTSNFEYTTLNKVLQSNASSTREDNGLDFTFLGKRIENTLSGMHDYDSRNRVIFFTQLQNSAISCWNIGTTFSPINMNFVHKKDLFLQYPIDIKVEGRNVWYLSNSLPTYTKTDFNSHQINFVIFKQPSRTLISGTSCESGIDGVSEKEGEMEVKEPGVEIELQNPAEEMALEEPAEEIAVEDTAEEIVVEEPAEETNLSSNEPLTETKF